MLGTAQEYLRARLACSWQARLLCASCPAGPGPAQECIAHSVFAGAKLAPARRYSAKADIRNRTAARSCAVSIYDQHASGIGSIRCPIGKLRRPHCARELYRWYKAHHSPARPPALACGSVYSLAYASFWKEGCPFDDVSTPNRSFLVVAPQEATTIATICAGFPEKGPGLFFF